MIKHLWRAHARRIFVSYRREDSQWFAGRLADSLAAYFGDKRVFRDIEGIAGGADFGEVIQDSLTASDAVIVVIGKDWLDARDPQGQRRLDKADDWVVQEVGTALAKGVPVFPVLVEDTPMPRAEDLLEALRTLTRFHAVSVSDSRWDGDTSRLAKIVSLDIPSATERRLRALNVLISASLALAMLFTLSALVWNMLYAASSAGGGRVGWEFHQLFMNGDDGRCKVPPDPAMMLLQNWQTAVIFIVLVAGSALMFTFSRHVDASARLAYDAAAWTGALGALTGFILYFLVCSEYEPVVNFYIGMVVAAAMLALMSVSGFRGK